MRIYQIGKEAMNKTRRGTKLKGKYNRDKDRKQTWSVTQTHGLPRNCRQSGALVSSETVRTDEGLYRTRRLGRNEEEVVRKRHKKGLGKCKMDW